MAALSTQDFEPYVLVAKKDVPPYDERLRGYFENKAVHIRHMAAGGVTFAVHPTAFVVHLPHPPSAARQWIIDPANQATRDLIQASLRSTNEAASLLHGASLNKQHHVKRHAVSLMASMHDHTDSEPPSQPFSCILHKQLGQL